MSPAVTYAGRVLEALSRLGKNGTVNPDGQHNIGRYLGELMLWQEVKRQATSRLEGARNEFKSSGIDDEATRPPGVHVIADSPHFIYQAKVTKPYNTLNKDLLIELLGKSKYKVPSHAARELIEKAHVAGSQRTTLLVVEK